MAGAVVLSSRAADARDEASDGIAVDRAEQAALWLGGVGRIMHCEGSAVGELLAQRQACDSRREKGLSKRRAAALEVLELAEPACSAIL